MSAAAIREDGGQVYVPAETMISLTRQIFLAAGCNAHEASSIATRLTGANLRGHDSHGVIRIPRYVQYIEEGTQVPNQTVDVILDGGQIAVVDGKFGFGQTVGEQTVDIGIAKAKESGVAVTALRNAGHLGRIGDWAERAADAGLVSIHMVNVRGSLIVAPFGGIDRRMSTSPFCAGFPDPDGPPLVLDMATSTVAEGKALVALKGGKPLPDGSIVDGDGTLTADPSPLYGEVPEGHYPNPNNGPGALTTFGLHKGSGLNFLMEMMAGALGGSGCAGALDEPTRRFCNGMFSMYFSPDAFGHADNSFVSEVRSYVAFVKSSRPTTPGGEVLVPGDKERAVMAERQVSGLPLAPQAWADIRSTARQLGVEDPSID